MCTHKTPASFLADAVADALRALLVYDVPASLTSCIPVILCHGVPESPLLTHVTASATMLLLCDVGYLLWTGTLTQNKMAVSRLWLAGREVQGLLDGPTNSSNGARAPELDDKVISTLVEGVALNSTAELRGTDSKLSSSTLAWWPEKGNPSSCCWTYMPRLTEC